MATQVSTLAGAIAILIPIMGLPAIASTQKQQNCEVNLPQPPQTFQLQNNEGESFFQVEEQSGESEKALAQHLSEKGAVMYGVYWCHHCYEQLRYFGVEAINTLNIIECASDGVNAQPAQCQQKFERIQETTGKRAGYPTWEIKGEFYIGTQSLKTLAEVSGYEGPQNFRIQPVGENAPGVEASSFLNNLFQEHKLSSQGTSPQSHLLDKPDEF